MVLRVVIDKDKVIGAKIKSAIFCGLLFSPNHEKRLSMLLMNSTCKLLINLAAHGTVGSTFSCICRNVMLTNKTQSIGVNWRPAHNICFAEEPLLYRLT